MECPAFEKYSLLKRIPLSLLPSMTVPVEDNGRTEGNCKVIFKEFEINSKSSVNEINKKIEPKTLTNQIQKQCRTLR